MTDEIVTMLRKEYEHFNNDGVGDYEVITAAADEIERLRAINIELLSVLRQTVERSFQPAIDGWPWWDAYVKYATTEEVESAKEWSRGIEENLKTMGFEQ